MKARRTPGGWTCIDDAGNANWRNGEVLSQGLPPGELPAGPGEQLWVVRGYFIFHLS